MRDHDEPPTPESHADERARHARQWQDNNRVAIEAYNRLVEQDGLFSDGARTF